MERSTGSATVGRFLTEIEETLGGGSPGTGVGDDVEFSVTGSGSLPSVFAVSDLATASVAAAGRAAARVARMLAHGGHRVSVDRRLASLWFRSTIEPMGWQPPSPWDSVAGIYPGHDRRIRLHTNVPDHRRAALEVLGLDHDPDNPPDRAAVTAAVGSWSADELETAIVAAGGCAAALRSEEEWRAHPQGQAAASEPLLAVDRFETARVVAPAVVEAGRPLAGVRVLDLTRVLAGPVATRFLAGLGADVLRLDPPDWNEPGLEPDVTRGKRCARIDLGVEAGRAHLLRLMAAADILVHGYRGDALERIGLGDDVRRAAAPGLVDVRLNAYGWTGPWRNRRGFDSLVQMSTGIADTGGRLLGPSAPRPLPVQALDHATGYLLAAAALTGWAERLTSGTALSAQVSLARTAHLLLGGPRTDPDTEVAEPGHDDWEPDVEPTGWGPARRLRPPIAVDGIEWRWDVPASPLGSETHLSWLSRRF